ncbi:tetratricopeptide repeat protein [Prochlorococcus sp. MIT 0916]|uniref:tetratricopeptide repeat protein n=1 Tax=Prochlorococcus sp. MIT 0916 TaxID=3082521 RepID=UPI0039B6C4AE
MNEFGEKEQEKKKVTEVKTFSVPLPFRDNKENITFTTSKYPKCSEEQLIQQALKLHSQGNVAEAAKYYQQCINLGFNDQRVFSNYGGILRDLGKLEEAELSTRKAIELKPDYAMAYSNLGSILKDLGKLEEAELSTRKAIELKTDFADAYSNLGGLLKDLGKLEEAELSTRKAIELKPDSADAYYNLSNILIDLGKSEEAELSTRQAIELKPNFSEAHDNLGVILEMLGKRNEAIFHWEKAVQLEPNNESALITLAHHLCFEKKYNLALKYLSKNKSNSSQTLYLGCLLSLEREKEFNEKYEEISKKSVCNANIGAIVEHANIIYQKRYESPFCNKAINYVLIDKINEESLSENYLNELISFTKNSKTNMRSQPSLEGGFQTSGNLFTLDFPFIQSMKKVLIEKIEIYKNHFKDSGQGFIKNWPRDYELRSWMISMKSGGFLKSHNHEYGWITGSFYLQIPKYNKNDNDSGNIAFSYQGPRYPSKQKDFNLTIKKIETRDICIFPSSLFHQTIPFESSDERICFVFDLIQK